MRTEIDPMTCDVLAVDPSICSAGVAIFRRGKLLAADTLISPLETSAPIGARCLRMAQEILEWSCLVTAEPRILVAEWPQVYRAAKSDGDPNDLIGLSGVVGAVAGILSMGLAARDRVLELVTPTPAEWIGNVPKIKTAKGSEKSPRLIRIKERLDDAELLILPSRRHDAVDATGLGLWVLGRLEPTRVYPGARGFETSSTL